MTKQSQKTIIRYAKLVSLLSLTLMLLLAACGGDDDGQEEDTGPDQTSTEAVALATEDSSPDQDAQAPTLAPPGEGTPMPEEVEFLNPLSQEEAEAFDVGEEPENENIEAPVPTDAPGPSREPGFRESGNISVVDSATYTDENGAAWIHLVVRNSAEAVLPNIEANLFLLDSLNRERNDARTTSAFLNIPPGYDVPMTIQFPAPTDYTDFFAFVESNPQGAGNFAQFVGEYDLPYTLDDYSPDTFPMTLSGTIQNDTGQTLLFPTGAFALYDSNDELLAVTYPYFEGLNERGEWEAGTELTFQATVVYLPSTDIGEITFANAGYIPPQQ